MAAGVKTGGRVKRTPNKATTGRTLAPEVPPLSTSPKPAHRPPYKPTNKDRKTVHTMVAGGIEQEQIIGVLGITRPTLRKYFRREIDNAAAEANTKVIANLYRIACGREKTAAWAAERWLKFRAGWKETQEIQHGGVDGKPITVVYSWADAPAK